MDEQEKERQRKEMRILDELADQYSGHYVVPTLPGKPEDDELIREWIKKRNQKLNRMKSYKG